MSTDELKKTPLNEAHKRLGGKMVDFGGWEMPVQYTAGVIEEHNATRLRAGLFDVSHMGEIWVEGRDAIRFVNRLTCNDVTQLADRQAHYTCLTNENGGVVDDLLVYRFGPGKLLLVVNAATTDKDWEWITGKKTDEDDVELKNASEEYCQIAIQGPRAKQILQTMTNVELDNIKYYWFEMGEVDGTEAIISRTGYTGEDGFEVYAAPEFAEQLWSKMLDNGRGSGILPCGLAARNTLRLEAAMSLYGNELGEDITTLESGLGWITKLEQEEGFVGRDALAELKEKGVGRKLVGFEMTEKGIARDGFDVYIGEEKVGNVTSGSPAPFLKKNIGLAFLPAEFAKTGQELKIDIRGKQVAAVVVPIPFYKREKP
ncbi:MAG TPA: glycine cleavage system aminomethyltransferase GcvT [Pyrinomonadaceae bacterium]|nr:glycine cleavage system aminomethyltransferase GcvT [Pyrinomonadaceae bacterium]HMP66888.1 glycine cleavage system aminomethyltransferase GcvT [Pyrinomonadaceae bacterium]